MSLVVVISQQAETISSGLQCWCRTKYRMSFSDDSVAAVSALGNRLAFWDGIADALEAAKAGNPASVP